MPELFPSEVRERLLEARIAATFSVESVEDAAPIARALLAGGVRAVELTLRTRAGIEAVRAIRKAVPEMLLGVGTILTPEQVVDVKAAGADFGVAPGMNPRVLKAAAEAELPFAPGIATPSELEAAIEAGYRLVKLFPAEPLGGVRYLRAIAAPYKHLGIRFFPLGGVNAENLTDYLQEPSVAVVGGTWMVDQRHVAAKDWDSLRDAATEAIVVANACPRVDA